MRGPSTTPAVILSLADTLVPVRGRIRACVEEINRLLAAHAGPAVRVGFRDPVTASRAGPCRVGGLAETVREVCEGAHVPPAVCRDLSELVDRHWRAPAAVRPGSLQFLQSLRGAGVRLGLLDAGDVALLRSVMYGTGLAREFDVTHLGVRLSPKEIRFVRSLLGDGEQATVFVGPWEHRSTRDLHVLPVTPEPVSFPDLEDRIMARLGADASSG